MPALKPLTYEGLRDLFADVRANVPRTVRNNTQVYLRLDDEGRAIFDVVLHGTTIATLHPDKVQMWASRRSATTRNRLNDILLPKHYKVIPQGDEWFVVSTVTEQSIRFEDNMVLGLPRK